ncbi:MAG: sulfatase-like hydrolase/transferase, partial [Gammaproteobacteria bacterium]
MLDEPTNHLDMHSVELLISAWPKTATLHSSFLLFPMIHFLCAQLFIYSFFVAILWYLARACGEFFSLTQSRTRWLGIWLWCFSVIAILAANCYLTPTAFFSKLILHDLFDDKLSVGALKWTLIATISSLGGVFLVSLFHSCVSVCKKQNLIRHISALFLMSVMAFCILNNEISLKSNSLPNTLNKQPNVILIGFDALRPDFVGSDSLFGTKTPALNQFLQTAIQFQAASTPLARTTPSWTAILTGLHPLHSHSRGNNLDVATLKLNETLATRLKQAGYETIYATDDRRYNNIDEHFGFDRVIGPPTGANDFLLGSFNDFPLSNLLIPTPLGRWLFPYSYANHGVPETYTPGNFLHLLEVGLPKTDKPIFLAVHFNLTGYPFYWFDSKKATNKIERVRYQEGVQSADKQFAMFMQMLAQKKLLNSALVVVLSDHGITLGLHNDRVISERGYQGNKINTKKIAFSKYSGASEHSSDFRHSYGMDTSFGYGGDILSLKQNHTLLAFKRFGYQGGKPFQVTTAVSLLDVTPTVLDLLHLAPLKQSDGISLKPYLDNSSLSSSAPRAFYFETSFTLAEIENETVSVGKVLKKIIGFYQIDPATGQVILRYKNDQAIRHDREFAIQQGYWLLAQYPSITRIKMVKGADHQLIFKTYQQASYSVLVNLRTGQWTTELKTGFAKQAPLPVLQRQLHELYNF